MAVLPAAMQVFRSRRVMTLLVGTVAVSVVVVFVPFLIASPNYTLAFFRTLSGRTGWETIWALLDGYTGYGVVAPISIRNDPATATWLPSDIRPSRLPWMWISAGFMLVGLWLWTRRIAWEDGRRSAGFAGLTLGMLLLYARGYSPQWGIYPAALAIVLLPEMRGLFYGLLFSVLMVLEWPVTFALFGDERGFLNAIVIIRTLATFALCVEFGGLVFPDTHWLVQVTKRLPLVVGVGLAGAMVVGAPFAASSYRMAQREREPLLPIIEGWESTPDIAQQVITAQPVIVERLTPLAPDQIEIMQIPNAFGEAWIDPATWIGTTVDAERATFVWLIEERGQAEFDALNAQLDQVLSSRYCKIAEEWHGTSRSVSFVPIAAAADTPAGTTFGGQVRLAAYGIIPYPIPQASAWCVGLQWEINGPVSASVVIVLELRSEAGEVITNRQQGPAGGTATWEEGSILLDGHGLLAALPPGRYWLHIGLLDTETGTFLIPEGDEMRTDDTIRLDAVTIE